MTKTELKKTVVKIKKLLKQRDYDAIDTGIELARALNEPAVFEALLGGWSIKEEVHKSFNLHPLSVWKLKKEWLNPPFKLVLDYYFNGETLTKTWSDETWPYFAYALVSLIGYAPENTPIDKSLKRSNIKAIDIGDSYRTKLFYPKNSELIWPQFPPGLANLPNLTSINLSTCSFIDTLNGLEHCKNLNSLYLPKNFRKLDELANLPTLTSLDMNSSTISTIDALANCKNLTKLNMSNCEYIQNIDGLTNLENLISLDLAECKSLQNLDGLANCINLTSLSLSICTSIQKINILVNLPNLTSLDLQGCKSVQDEEILADLAKLTKLNVAYFLKDVNVLATLINLTSLRLEDNRSLEDVDGLAKLTNLTSLNLIGCDKVQLKPSKEVMTTRKEVAAYQEEIKKSMS